MGHKFARLDGHWIGNLDDTGAPDRRRKWHLIDANAVSQKVNRSIHMRSRVDAERHLRDIADIAAIHIHRALNVYRGIVRPMHHARPQRNRNIHPFICHANCSFSVVFL